MRNLPHRKTVSGHVPPIRSIPWEIKLISLSRAWSLVPLVALCFATLMVQAIVPPGPGSYTYLDSWSFNATNTWISDLNKAPVSFTNLSVTTLGDGYALIVDSANPAWLQYNVMEADGTTNLCVGPQGSLLMWFAPANWAGTNQDGGTGPGVWGRLIEAGWATNGSPGFWSLYLDDAGCNLYFSASEGSSTVTYLAAPVELATNRWHHIGLTFSSTNTALYLDGALLTNGAALTVWPGTNVLANGFFIGSDSTGIAQAHAWFDDISTYNFVLDGSTIASIFDHESLPFIGNPLNIANLRSAQPYPTNTPTFDVISGPGNLTLTNYWIVGACVSSSTAWMTNVSAWAVGTNMNLMFSLQGGPSGTPWDVFATATLSSPLTNAQWAWMGRGFACNTYVLTNLPSRAFVILGNAAIDSDGDGLPNAYEALVSHTDPYNAYTAGDGIPDGWKVLWNLNATNSIASQDPDFDGLSNWQEYLWGSNPNVSEGLAIWVGTPAGFSGIP
jgi:hypothetical protein